MRSPPLDNISAGDPHSGWVAKDIAPRFGFFQALFKGKVMIVAVSRCITAALYASIEHRRPGWDSDDNKAGRIKVVMTGSASDPPAFQPHVRNKFAREVIEKRFEDPDDALELVIVRDMWLTGFDVRSPHTMYVDKPM